jgi:hypothetical protein
MRNEPHITELDYYSDADDTEAYKAFCMCGWAGDWHDAQQAALAEGDAHLVELRLRILGGMMARWTQGGRERSGVLDMLAEIDHDELVLLFCQLMEMTDEVVHRLGRQVSVNKAMERA